MVAYHVAGLETMLQLAFCAGVSVATVLRFANKLGFEGCPDFQRQLREEIQERHPSPFALYGSALVGSGTAEVLSLGRQTVVEALDLTYSRLSKAKFNAVVDLLANSRLRISCTGSRLSQILAIYLGAHLQTLRPQTRFLVETLQPRIDHLVDIARSDVFVVFDYRCHQADTIDFARRAHKRGAVVVQLTDLRLSPIAAFAHQIVPAGVATSAPFDSMVPGMAIVETLVASLSARLSDAAQSRMVELEHLREGVVVDEDAGRRSDA